MTEDAPERAVVLSGTGGVWQIRTAGGETLSASMRGRLKKANSGLRPDGSRRRDTIEAAAATLKLAVGDEVLVERDEGGAVAIAEILPRRSRLARRNPGGGYGERVVVANIDQVIVVFAAAKPEPHPRMLDRFLVVAEANQLAARIVVNKVDLVGQGDAAAGEAEVRARFAAYERAGYPVHVTSVARGAGLDELGAALRRRTSALSGPSGVGKSSLMNALYPGLNLRVGEISESVNKGRHTTVGAVLHPLPDGGFVVDTPGLREIGMWGLPVEELSACFPEFRPYLNECRFADCIHSVEPGCAVRTAVDAGDIGAERYESYLKLRQEIVEGTPAW